MAVEAQGLQGVPLRFAFDPATPHHHGILTIHTFPGIYTRCGKKESPGRGL